MVKQGKCVDSVSFCSHGAFQTLVKLGKRFLLFSVLCVDLIVVDELQFLQTIYLSVCIFERFK